MAELWSEEAANNRARPERDLRRLLKSLIHQSAALAYDDLHTTSVVETFLLVLARLDDPAQKRTGSLLEQASLECVEQLREPLAAVGEPGVDLDRDERIAQEPLLRIPPLVLVGRATRDAYFPMAYWNAIGSCQEGIVSPYSAAGLVIHVGFHRRAEYGEFLNGLEHLRARYEDEPEARRAIAADITDVLDEWLARNPVR
jgi:hypothetical protein